MTAAREVVALDSCAGVVPDDGLEFELVTRMPHSCKINGVSVRQRVQATDSSKYPKS